MTMPVLLGKKVLALIFGHLNPKRVSLNCLLSMSFMRSFTLGFCHGYLNGRCSLQQILMITLETMFLWMLVGFRRAYFSKIVLLFTLSKQVFRVVLHVILLIRNYTKISESSYISDIFAGLELTVIGAVFAAAVL